MNYRPEGFKNPYKKRTPMYKGISVHYEAFEAGADAMLEGLKKEGEPRHLECDCGCCKPKGYLVFIPEEKEVE